MRVEKGELYSVCYDQVNAMLLNEFLKEHQRIEEQDKRIDQLTAQLETASRANPESERPA